MWLEAPVEETDERGRSPSDDPEQGRGTRDARKGLRSRRCWRTSTCVGSSWAGRRWGTSSVSSARIVNYADDFVICCRGTADEAMAAMRGMMSKLKLTVNETKTRLCRVPEETFDFLGYTIGRCYCPRTGRVLHRADARRGRRSQRLCREISELTDRRWASRRGRGAGGETQPETAGLVELLPPGHGAARPTEPWTATCGTGSASGCRPSTRCRVRGTTRFPDEYLYENWGCPACSGRAGSFPWAKA